MSREFMTRIQEAITLLGGTVERGKKHQKVRFQNGGTVIIPGTPSDHRALMNSLKEMERESGRKLPKRVSGGGRTKHRRAPGLLQRPGSAPTERRQEIQELQAELERVDATLQRIADDPDSSRPEEFLRHLSRWEKIADTLAEKGQDSPAEWMRRV